MSRTFKIDREIEGTDLILYKKKHVTFEPGVTVLIGCNGCGKTTLLRQIRHIVEQELHLPCVYYDNIADGGSSSMRSALDNDNIDFLVTMFVSSEGEGIMQNMMRVAWQIGQVVQKHPESDEYWVLLDGMDSGLSIDAIEEIKQDLFRLVMDRNPGKDIYIIASANEYEMARGEHCFDTVNCRYVNVKSYERYRSIILRSRKYKDKRYEKA